MPFLTLPREVRLRVYFYVFRDPHVVLTIQDTSENRTMDGGSLLSAMEILDFVGLRDDLTRTCKLVREESLPELLKYTTLVCGAGETMFDTYFPPIKTCMLEGIREMYVQMSVRPFNFPFEALTSLQHLIIHCNGLTNRELGGVVHLDRGPWEDDYMMGCLAILFKRGILDQQIRESNEELVATLDEPGRGFKIDWGGSFKIVNAIDASETWIDSVIDWNSASVLKGSDQVLTTLKSIKEQEPTE